MDPAHVAEAQRAAPALLARAGGARHDLVDKGSDNDALRRSLREAGAVPVIPGRATRKRWLVYDMDRERHRVEDDFRRLKTSAGWPVTTSSPTNYLSAVPSPPSSLRAPSVVEADLPGVQGRSQLLIEGGEGVQIDDGRR